MTEEKQLILNMLKEGKITVEEASDLLAAIGDKKSKETDFAGKITSCLLYTSDAADDLLTV